MQAAVFALLRWERPQENPFLILRRVVNAPIEVDFAELWREVFCVAYENGVDLHIIWEVDYKSLCMFTVALIHDQVLVSTWHQNRSFVDYTGSRFKHVSAGAWTCEILPFLKRFKSPSLSFTQCGSTMQHFGKDLFVMLVFEGPCNNRDYESFETGVKLAQATF